MPTNSADQQITTPIGTDAPARIATAFTDFLADVETRLMCRYASIADRTARHPVSLENELSGLADLDRIEVYDGTNHISLQARSLYTLARRTADAAAVNNSTVLVNDAVMASALVINASYYWDNVIFYDSATAADFKVAFTWPAGATARWGIMGIGTPGATDAVASTAAASGTSIAVGGLGVGTGTWCKIEGFIDTAGTAGNLQTQYAQQTADPTNTTVRRGSIMRVYRVA